MLIHDDVSLSGFALLTVFPLPHTLKLGERAVGGTANGKRMRKAAVKSETNLKKKIIGRLHRKRGSIVVTRFDNRVILAGTVAQKLVCEITISQTGPWNPVKVGNGRVAAVECLCEDGFVKPVTTRCQ